eukprot:TRINITY_DN67031_c6_g6_i2.p1 TRINITY_DN67031_c6_g6~~TRINITY_DN67031_c6_g6_i2.p1  ORF type:complete len:792 (-),score=43.96 TRINITY_DN67031_c6_g6_i2:1255-3555(-)
MDETEYTHFNQALGATIKRWRAHVQAEGTILANPLLQACEYDFEALMTKHKNQCFVVALIALCKSGKSTFLNALMGCDYLPSHNLPETARIVRVDHTPELPEGRLTDPHAHEHVDGHTNIKNRLKSFNDEARARGIPSPNELRLEVPFVALKNKSFHGQRFSVLDTPGPNEAKGSVMVQQVKHIMAKADVILYLLDYTKLKTKEEQEMFATLRELRSDLCEGFQDRIFLIVNKMDLRNRNGLTPSETVEYIAKLLQTDLPGLNVDKSRVIPVSAENALLARQIENGTANEAVRADIVSKLYGCLQDEDVELDKLKADAPQLLKKSGVEELERKVITFLYNNKARILMDSTVGDTMRHLSRVHNYLITCRAALATQKNLKEVARLKADLDNVAQTFHHVVKAFDGTRTSMHNWVKKQFSDFKLQCNHYLQTTLESTEYCQVTHTSKEEVTISIAQQSAKLSKHLEDMFRNFRLELESDAYKQQEVLFDSLSKEIQPLVARVEKEVGEFLDIGKSLYPVSVRLSWGEQDDFSTDIDRHVEQMVSKTTGELNFQQDDTTGWCRWFRKKHTVRIPVEVYTSNTGTLVDHWKSIVDANTDQSTHTSISIISSKVNAALQNAQQYLQSYIDSYGGAIQHTIKIFNANETKRQTRLQHINALIDDLKADMRALVSMKFVRVNEDWQQRIMSAIEADERQPLAHTHIATPLPPKQTTTTTTSTSSTYTGQTSTSLSTDLQEGGDDSDTSLFGSDDEDLMYPAAAPLPGGGLVGA